MKRATHILLVGFLFGLTVWLSEVSVRAQFRVNPYQVYAQARIAQQNWYAQQLIASQAGKTYGTNYGIPIYASSVANYYAPYYSTPYYPPVYTPPVYTPPVPYAGNYANPYAPVAPGYGVNPYSPVDPNVANPYSPYSPYNPYNPYYPYGGYGAGSVLMGQADVMRAYGQQVNSIEQARIVREQAKQAQIETKWKQFEFEMKVKAATPTYTQEQERIGKITLQRIQKFSTSGEIVGGKSLNYLLEDLDNFRTKTLSGEEIKLSEEVLLRLNVTGKKGGHGMGLLRDGGKVTFPPALQDAKGRAELEKQLVSLVKTANNNGKIGGILTDVRSAIDSMREDLVKRVNETQTSQYIDAKQFLQDLYDGSRALEDGQAATYAKYKRWVEEGRDGRTVQELVKWMGDNGYRFAPATRDDEAAYRAVHSALASYDIAMNSQYGEVSKE